MSDTITVLSCIHGERVFHRVGSEPYCRRDGSQTKLVRWQSKCVVCDATFEVKTPHYVTKAEDSKSFLSTTCSRHRLTPREVASLRYARFVDRQSVWANIKTRKLRDK